MAYASACAPGTCSVHGKTWTDVIASAPYRVFASGMDLPELGLLAGDVSSGNYHDMFIVKIHVVV